METIGPVADALETGRPYADSAAMDSLEFRKPSATAAKAGKHGQRFTWWRALTLAAAACIVRA
jgi:hypothetical protein